PLPRHLPPPDGRAAPRQQGADRLAGRHRGQTGPRHRPDAGLVAPADPGRRPGGVRRRRAGTGRALPVGGGAPARLLGRGRAAEAADLLRTEPAAPARAKMALAGAAGSLLSTPAPSAPAATRSR